MKMIKPILYSLFIIPMGFGVISSCTSPPKSELNQLIAKRDSLKTELVAVENRIIALDTSNASLPPLVSIDTVKQGIFNHYIELQGIVEADKNVIITSEIPAIIRKIYVKEGQSVKKGTLLVMLDDEMIKNQIKELQTQLKLAEYVYEKQSNLRKENIGSELDFEKAKNNKEHLESALNTARAQQSKAKIIAAYDGIVDEIFPKTGELTNPQMPLIRFVSIGNVSIQVDVPESYLGKINKGDFVSVNFPDLDKIYSSEISSRGNFIEPLNRTFRIVINLPGNDDFLLPNLIGVVKINDLTVENAILVNIDHILQDGEGRDYVFRIEEQGDKVIARKVFIQKGETYANVTYVKSGLQKSDRIVTQGARSIIDGEEVQYLRINNGNSNLTLKQ